MNKSTDEEIRSIFIDVLDLAEDSYKPDLRREDVENWDSIAHVSLVMSVEHAFQIRIAPKDAAALSSPRAFIEKIEGLGPKA